MHLSDFIFFIAVIALGYASAVFRLLAKGTEDALPKLLMNISYPAMILATFTGMDLEKIAGTGLFSAVATAVITFALFVTSKFFTAKMAESSRALLRFQSGIGNVVYVAIPLLNALFGSEYLYIIMIHSVVQDVFIWLLYFPMMAGQNAVSLKKRIREIVGNPCMVALALALIFQLGALPLPSVIVPTIERLGGTAAPLALLYLGFLIRKHGMWRWVRDRFAIIYAALKTIALPLVTVAVLLPFTDLKTAIILGMLFGAPAPIMSIVWASYYDGDVPRAINNCISSTVIYIATTSFAGFILLHFGII